MAESFKKDLTTLISKYDIENVSKTPNSLLASFLESCLAAFELTTIRREGWHRKKEISELVKRILNAGYEPIEPGNSIGDSAQLINGQWYAPKWGCDTLQHVIEIIEQLSGEEAK